MTHFEVESISQMNIYEFLEITPSPARNNAFMVGDKVKIRFYVDELSYVQQWHSELLGVGEIAGKKLDFYCVMIGERIIEIHGEKLMFV